MNGAYQDEIITMSNFRYKLIENLQQLGDSNEKEERDLNQKIDELSEQIQKSIRVYYDYLSFEFIMEQLSKLGHCPNLLNDDNGNWAVTTTGFQNVVYGDEPQDVNTQFFVEAKNWKPTPREALKHYLTDEE
jgi:hypothetical protein